MPRSKRRPWPTTWACNKFREHIFGKDIQIETDHKPLVPLFDSKNLDEMPPRIQDATDEIFLYNHTRARKRSHHC